MSQQRVEADKLRVIGNDRGEDALVANLPSTRAIFAAKGGFSTNQDILFERVSATRTDKVGKELVAVVRDLVEYLFATGRLSRRVLPNADRNTTSRIQDLEMAVVRNVGERSCEIFSRVAQDASQHSPAHI